MYKRQLLDRGVDAEGTYAAGNAKDIDLAAASLYFTLAAHPELREGAFSIKYSGVQLIAMAKMILQKYGEDAAMVNGAAIW